VADQLAISQDHTIQDHLVRILGRRDLVQALLIIPEHVMIDAEISGSWDHLRHLDRPILNLSTNPIDIAGVRSRAQQIWGPDGYLMLGWDAHSTAPDLVYWPYFFLTQRLQIRQVWQPRCYRISMLSGIPRPHRIQLWRLIRSHVRPQDMVVVNRFSHWSQDPDLSRDLPWSNHPAMIESDQERSLTATPTTSIDHPAYLACVNLPVETVWNQDLVFITEKTWKALMSGLMPWHGYQPMAQYLLQLGFADWFGETGTAAVAVRDLFDREDLWEFYHDHASQVQAAQDRFWSDQLVIQQTQTAIHRLENWVRA
jgi:hypothetical protein